MLCFAVKSTPKHEQINHNLQTTTVESSIDDEFNENKDGEVEVSKKPTWIESWGKVVTLKWTSLSRDDAWNIGGSVTLAGVVYYIWSCIPKNGPIGPDNHGGPMGGTQAERDRRLQQEQEDQRLAQALEEQEREEQAERDSLQELLRLQELGARQAALQRQQELREQQEQAEERNRQLRQQEQDDLRYARQLQQEEQAEVDHDRQVEQEEIEQRIRHREEFQRRQAEAQLRAQMEEERNAQLQQEAEELAAAIEQSQLEAEKNNNSSTSVNKPVEDDQVPEVVVNPSQQRDCDICAETRNINEYTVMPCCQYSLCTVCLIEHLSSCLDKNSIAEVKCPNQTCETKLIEAHVMQEITLNNSATYDRYLNVGLNECLNKEAQIKQCPTA